MKRKTGGLTVVLIPDEGGESRSLRFSRKGVRWLVFGGGAVVLVLAVMATSWWFLAMEASQGWRLEARVDSLEAERVRVLRLADQLAEVEAGYDRLRSLFGPSAEPVAPDLWLPPSGIPGSQRVAGGSSARENVPSGWPLTEAGFMTQPMVEEGSGGGHPGLDIAVPTDSYVRAAGAGRILRTGEDPVYGLFIVMDHGDGYQTVYAHNSMILTERGAVVRRGEVIALTGSTGRSTAPHLHFEVLLDGIPLDPLSLVEPPG